jgi:ribosomal protein L40E
VWPQGLASVGFSVSAHHASIISWLNLFMDKNPTKKCPQCFAEVPVDAKKCSHCGSKLPQKTSMLVKVLAIVFGIGLFTSIFAAVISPSSGAPSTPVAPSAYQLKLSAQVYSESYIERLLKSPSTAKFCHETVTDLGENRWRVSSCVDSQNSYGAMIRSDWETTLSYLGGDIDTASNWKLEKAIFDGKIIYAGGE